MADQLAQLLSQNPYYVAGAQFGQQRVIPDDVSPWEAMALQIAQGLGSGVLSGYGRAQVEGQQAADTQQLAQALAQPTFEKKVQALASSPQHAELATLLVAEQLKNQNKLELEDQFDAKKHKRENPYLYQDGAMQTAQSGPASQEIFPGGPESLNNKFQQTYQQFRQQGAPGGAAIEAANALTAAQRKAMTGGVDKVAKARETGQKMLDLAATAKAGVSGAGSTGGTAYGLRNAFSNVLATTGISSDAVKEQSYRGQLASIEPELIQTFRSPGAITEKEGERIIGAGPSVSKLPTTNQALIQKMETLGQLQLDYADFLDAYREEKGTTQGAEKLWQAYKRDHPIYTEAGPGQEVVINTNRPSWQEYLTGAAPTVGEQPRSVDPAGAPADVVQGQQQPAQAGGPTKVVNGVTYQKVAGGWQAVP